MMDLKHIIGFTEKLSTKITKTAFTSWRLLAIEDSSNEQQQRATAKYVARTTHSFYNQVRSITC